MWSSVDAEVIGGPSTIHLELDKPTINILELVLIVVEPLLL